MHRYILGGIFLTIVLGLIIFHHWYITPKSMILSSVHISDVHELRNLINSEYQKSISSLGTIVAVATYVLAAFTIIFGLFYFNKMKEANELIKMIEAAPEQFFEKYYEKLVLQNMNNLFSEDENQRGAALEILKNHPELHKQYNLLVKLLNNELQYDSSQIYPNLQKLILMMKLQESDKTNIIIWDLIEQYKLNSSKAFNLLGYAKFSKEVRGTVARILSHSTDISVKHSIVQKIGEQGLIDEYAPEIIVNSTSEELTSYWNVLERVKFRGVYPWLNKRTDCFIDNMYSRWVMSDILTIDNKISLCLETENEYAIDLFLRSDEGVFLKTEDPEKYKVISDKYEQVKSKTINDSGDLVEAGKFAIVDQKVVDANGDEYEIIKVVFTLMGYMPLADAIMYKGRVVPLEQIKSRNALERNRGENSSGNSGV